VVGDLFKGLGRKREADAVEPLDQDSICARIGEPRIPVTPMSTQPQANVCYLRVDGPQAPVAPRNWRAGTQGSSR
jgi:hypothetical protein